MIGLMVFLICLIIVVILGNLLLDQLGATITPKIRLVLGLLILLLVIIWMFGGGGWGHLYTWHP